MDEENKKKAQALEPLFTTFKPKLLYLVIPREEGDGRLPPLPVFWPPTVGAGHCSCQLREGAMPAVGIPGRGDVWREVDERGLVKRERVLERERGISNLGF